MIELPMPGRQVEAIELQREIMARPPGAAFHQSFVPHELAVALLARIAASSSGFALEAREVLDLWRDGLATPEQVASLFTDDDLEIGAGAVVSESDDGYWISAWAWVDTP